MASQFTSSYLASNKRKGEGLGNTVNTWLGSQLSGRAKSYIGGYAKALLNDLNRLTSKGEVIKGKSVTGAIAYYPAIKSNPSSLKVKSGEWIPCHAVRVKGGKLEIMKDALANPTRKRNVGTNLITTLNAKQDFIMHKRAEKEKEYERVGDALERLGNKITTAEKDRIYGAEFNKLKKKWMTIKKQLSAITKQSNANLVKIHKAAKSY